MKYNLELPSDIPLPHFSVVKNICLCAEVRAVAYLELRQNQEAFTNLLIGFRLADSLQYEPLLISQLVRMGDLQIDLQTIREGLMRHAWSDDQLKELETRLASVDLLAECRDAMRGERAMCIATLEFTRAAKMEFCYRFVDFCE